MPNDVATATIEKKKEEKEYVRYGETRLKKI
jgi:hypothetical protein